MEAAAIPVRTLPAVAHSRSPANVLCTFAAARRASVVAVMIFVFISRTFVLRESTDAIVNYSAVRASCWVSSRNRDGRCPGTHIGPLGDGHFPRTRLNG